MIFIIQWHAKFDGIVLIQEDHWISSNDVITSYRIFTSLQKSLSLIAITDTKPWGSFSCNGMNKVKQALIMCPSYAS